VILNHERDLLGLTRYTELKGAPPVLAMTTVGVWEVFRGLISKCAVDSRERSSGTKANILRWCNWRTGSRSWSRIFTQVWLVLGLEQWRTKHLGEVQGMRPDRWRWGCSWGIELLAGRRPAFTIRTMSSFIASWRGFSSTRLGATPGMTRTCITSRCGRMRCRRCWGQTPRNGTLLAESQDRRWISSGVNV